MTRPSPTARTGASVMTDRIRLQDLTSADLDRLYEERDLLRGFVDVVALELDNWTDGASPELLRAELNTLDGPSPDQQRPAVQ